MNFPTSTARKTAYGFKAVIVRANGSTHVVTTKNFRTREEAIAMADRFILANYSHDAHIRKYRAEKRFDAQFEAMKKAGF